MTRPVDVIGAAAVAALRAAGWIVVREDAIRLAQIDAEQNAKDETMSYLNIKKIPYTTLEPD